MDAAPGPPGTHAGSMMRSRRSASLTRVPVPVSGPPPGTDRPAGRPGLLGSSHGAGVTCCRSEVWSLGLSMKTVYLLLRGIAIVYGRKESFGACSLPVVRFRHAGWRRIG